MKLLKTLIKVLVCIVILLLAVFLIGRYAWKLGGFSYCETAGIEQINVEENQVQIRGFYPGSFPQGFIGYYAKQVDDTLYVGFKFSGVFGIFENGDFDIVIPAVTDGISQGYSDMVDAVVEGWGHIEDGLQYVGGAVASGVGDLFEDASSAIAGWLGF